MCTGTSIIIVDLRRKIKLKSLCWGIKFPSPDGRDRNVSAIVVGEMANCVVGEMTSWPIGETFQSRPKVSIKRAVLPEWRLMDEKFMPGHDTVVFHCILAAKMVTYIDPVVGLVITRTFPGVFIPRRTYSETCPGMRR